MALENDLYGSEALPSRLDYSTSGPGDSYAAEAPTYEEPPVNEDATLSNPYETPRYLYSS